MHEWAEPRKCLNDAQAKRRFEAAVINARSARHLYDPQRPPYDEVIHAANAICARKRTDAHEPNAGDLARLDALRVGPDARAQPEVQESICGATALRSNLEWGRKHGGARNRAIQPKRSRDCEPVRPEFQHQLGAIIGEQVSSEPKGVLSDPYVPSVTVYDSDIRLIAVACENLAPTVRASIVLLLRSLIPEQVASIEKEIEEEEKRRGVRIILPDPQGGVDSIRARQNPTASE